MNGAAAISIIIPVAIVLFVATLLSFIQRFIIVNRSIKILIAVIVPIVVLIVFFVYFSDYIPFSFYPTIFIFTGLVSILFIMGAKGPLNATLTCKNGHTCPVWVNFSPWGFGPSYDKGGTIWHVGGKPMITPQRCPKCGAYWQTPHKHNKLNTTGHYRNMK